MKKTILLLSGIIAFGFSNAQQPQVATQLDKAVKANRHYATGAEELGPVSDILTKAASSEVIGNTVYDLQTNYSMQNRLVNHENGTFSATFTFSASSAGGNPDRGAGYTYYDGSSWSGFPIARVETERCGWPTLLYTNTSEILISHSTASSKIVMNKRSTTGSGAWTQSFVPGNVGFWPRAAASGSSIHLIALTVPTANGGTVYNGLDGGLLYFRSQDEGASWDLQDVHLPGLDSSEVTGTTADSYAIAAQGNTVAVAVFGGWDDVILIKSTDNGDTWTKTIINDFPFVKHEADDGSDVDGDGIADTLSTSDQSGNVILDASGNAHVFYGNMRVLDADLADGNTSFFPGTNGMMYWNETMGGGPVEITGAPDEDGDGILLGTMPAGTDIPTYFMSLSAMPSAGIDASGNIYLSFAAVKETVLNFGGQPYRHIYVVKSTDGGATWTEPTDVTPNSNDLGMLECVFPGMATVVDSKVHLVYQRDFEVSLAIRGDMHPVVTNDIVYVSVPVDDITQEGGEVEETEGIEEYGMLNSFSIYPNPASDNLTLNFSLLESSSVNIAIYDVVGKKVLNENIQNSSVGLNSIPFDISNLNEGVYFTEISAGKYSLSQKLVVTK